MEMGCTLNRTQSFYIRPPARGGHKQFMIDNAKKSIAESKGKQGYGSTIVDVVISPAFGMEPTRDDYEYDLFYVFATGDWSHISRADLGYMCSKHPANGCNCGF